MDANEGNRNAQNPFATRVETECPALASRFGFVVVDSTYSEEFFGNAVLVLKNQDGIYLQIVNERGDTFVDLAKSADGPWWDLDLLIAYAGGIEPLMARSEDLEFRRRCDRLVMHLPSIAEVMRSRRAGKIDREIKRLRDRYRT
jgi:hypothetical protein